MPEIRLASFDDLPGILAISNWAARHTAANFAVEPETLESWQQDWHDTHERYPWFVAADEDDRVIGFAKASPWKGRCANRAARRWCCPTERHLGVCFVRSWSCSQCPTPQKPAYFLGRHLLSGVSRKTALP